MVAEYRYDPGLNAIEVTTHGTAGLIPLVEMVEHIAELCEQHASAHVLIDHSRLDAAPLNMNDIRSVSHKSALLGEAFRTHKFAHVAVQDLQFGLVRAWETLAGLSGFGALDNRLFRSRDEAIAWLTTPE